MTEQSNSAAERSAHVHRGDAPSPTDWPVVRMPDGTWKLKSVVALENRIAELKALAYGLMIAMSASGDDFADILKEARAVLGGKDE